MDHQMNHQNRLDLKQKGEDLGNMAKIECMDGEMGGLFFYLIFKFWVGLVNKNLQPKQTR